MHALKSTSTLFTLFLASIYNHWTSVGPGYGPGDRYLALVSVYLDVEEFEDICRLGDSEGSCAHRDFWITEDGELVITSKPLAGSRRSSQDNAEEWWLGPDCPVGREEANLPRAVVEDSVGRQVSQPLEEAGWEWGVRWFIPQTADPFSFSSQPRAGAGQPSHGRVLWWWPVHDSPKNKKRPMTGSQGP